VINSYELSLFFLISQGYSGVILGIIDMKFHIFKRLRKATRLEVTSY